VEDRHAKLLFVAGCLNALCAVAAGAFAAHVLTRQLDEYRLELFRTGAAYQMYHALGMLIATLVAAPSPSRWALRAAVLFLFGILLFSGSLYLLALVKIRFLGLITPVGGVLFLLGWLLLAFAALRRSG